MRTVRTLVHGVRAVLRIQCAQRRRAAVAERVRRAHAAQRRRASVKLQAAGRRKQAHSWLACLRAAVLLQRHARRRAAQAEAARRRHTRELLRRHEEEEARRTKGARTIQARGRGRNARAWFSTARAARAIQAAGRRRPAVVRLRKQRVAAERLLVAARHRDLRREVTRSARARLLSERALIDTLGQPYQARATSIRVQTIRAEKAAALLGELVREQQQAASSQIGRVGRGRVVRRGLERQREMQAYAAQLITAATHCVRDFLVDYTLQVERIGALRQGMRRMRVAATRVQADVRCRGARHGLTRAVRASSLLCARVRGRNLRRVLAASLVHTSVVRLQADARRRGQRHRFVHQRHAAARLQAAWRGDRTRKALRAIRRAADVVRDALVTHANRQGAYGQATAIMRGLRHAATHLTTAARRYRAVRALRAMRLVALRLGAVQRGRKVRAGRDMVNAAAVRLGRWLVATQLRGVMRKRMSALRRVRHGAATRLQAVRRGKCTRRALRAHVEALQLAPCIEVRLWLEQPPLGAAEALTTSLLVLARRGLPPLRVSRAQLELIAAGRYPGAGAGGVGLLLRLRPSARPGDASASDAAAALLRAGERAVGEALGVPLLQPLTAQLRLGLPPAPPLTRPAVSFDPLRASGAAVAAAAAAAAAEDAAAAAEEAAAAAAAGPVALRDAAEAGAAEGEARRRQAMRALLTFAREEERLADSDDEAARGDAEADTDAAPLARRYAVQRDASLLAAVQTALPIAARALLRLRLSPHANAAEPAAAVHAAARAAAEPAPIRTFACFTPPSPFEPPRGAARGRRLRWVSHGVEVRCPPRPPAAVQFDSVFEGGAHAAAAQFGLLLQPLLRAALRGVSGALLVCGQSGTGKSRALFGDAAAAGSRGTPPPSPQHALGAPPRPTWGLAQRCVAQLLGHFGEGAVASGAGSASVGEAGEAWSAQRWSVQLSMLQLHPTAEGEQPLDLLQPSDGATAHNLPLKLREWHAGRDGGERCWPEGLARVDVHSIADFEELLAAGLDRRRGLLPPAIAALAHAAWPAGAQPLALGHTALVLHVTGPAAEGDTLSAQLELWGKPVEGAGLVAPQLTATLAAWGRKASNLGCSTHS